MLIGLLAGIATGALWGLTFIAPLAVAPISAWDLMVARYEVFGLASLLLMISRRFRPGGMAAGRIVTGLLLGGLGYTGYVGAIFFAVKLSGVAIPPLIVGTAPILLALVAQRGDAAVPIRDLLVPLALIATGLLTVNAGAFTTVGAADHANLLAGIGCACVSLLVWVAYAFVNNGIMQAADAPDALRWTGVQGIGAALGSLCLLPLTSFRGSGDVLSLARSDAGHRFLLWVVVMGLGGSWLATWCWVTASRLLPLGLAAQLIVGETLFGLLYGFLYEGRWPRATEAAGAFLQMAGVVAAVAIFNRGERPATRPGSVDAHRPPAKPWARHSRRP